MNWNFKRKSYFYLALSIFLIFQACMFYILNKSERKDNYNTLKIFESYKSLGKSLNEASQFDATGKYKILSLNSQRSRNMTFDVTLVSQCSSDHIHFIGNLVTVWNGPISIAVFDEGDNVERTLWMLAKMLICYKDKKLKLHLVVPAQSVYIKDLNQEYKTTQEPDKFQSCNFYVEKNSRRNYERKLPYPVNLLRNVAKLMSSTDYVFVLDIDMTPNQGLHENFLDYVRLNQAKDKIVYVVPAFEIEEKYKSPENKHDLMALMKANVCRPFYFLPCPDCQQSTQYEKWMLSNTTSETKPLYQVKWKHPWEPFFIGPSNIPNFDERFQQYGMNRVSQICELHVAGYEFHVLDNAFITHRGLKRKKDFHATKNAEMKRNRVLYERFKKELRYKYPKSNRKC